MALMWAVYHGPYRITKEPMTEYDARNAKNHWDRLFANVEVREIVEPKIEEPPKPRKKKRSRMCFG
jgi:hypothetical protein